ncbi:Transcription elongation factor Spt4 [uncultured archaeon]|nr:Transcription elongation factor Spt4 [uncultured archaeon]
MNACKVCKRLADDEATACPHCGGATTQYWSGYLGVLDAKESKIANKVSIKEDGQYALKVR